MSRLTLLLLLTMAEVSAQIQFTSSAMEMTLDASNGYGIASLYLPGARRDFIAPAKLPLYRITLSEADGTTAVITSAAIRSLYYPQWPAPLRLGRGEDRLLYPFLDGQEFISPGEHMREGRLQSAQYPGQAAMQLMAYYDDNSGLLQMTPDGNGWVKHFRAGRIPGALDLSIEHNPDETPGRRSPSLTTSSLSHSAGIGGTRPTSTGNGPWARNGRDGLRRYRGSGHELRQSRDADRGFGRVAVRIYCRHSPGSGTSGLQARDDSALSG